MWIIYQAHKSIEMIKRISVNMNQILNWMNKKWTLLVNFILGYWEHFFSNIKNKIVN